MSKITDLIEKVNNKNKEQQTMLKDKMNELLNYIIDNEIGITRRYLIDKLNIINKIIKQEEKKSCSLCRQAYCIINESFQFIEMDDKIIKKNEFCCNQFKGVNK
jgi:hypothetical protein